MRRICLCLLLLLSHPPAGMADVDETGDRPAQQVSRPPTTAATQPTTAPVATSQPTTAPATNAAALARLKALQMAPAVAVGSPAPPLRLMDLNGRLVSLDSLSPRVVVLVFGSYSNPSFRQRLPALKELADRQRNRADYFIVYTREAHAVDEWEVERNRLDRVAVRQPADTEARLRHVRRFARRLKYDLPILVDTIDDATARAYGLFPNGAVVIDKDRTVAAVQQWLDPHTLEEHVLQAAGR